jgi:hypothetical protein
MLLRVQHELDRILMQPAVDREDIVALRAQLNEIAVGAIMATGEMKERRTNDDYQTDPRLIEAFFKTEGLLSSAPQRVLDLGAGIGEWGKGLVRRYENDVPLQVGIETQPNLMPPAIYGRRIVGDVLDPSLTIPFDPAHGGPGYTHIGWNFPYGNVEHRDLITEFLYRAYGLLAPEGPSEIWSLCRMNWLAGAGRARELFGGDNPTHLAWKEDIVILATRPTFYYPIPARTSWEGGTLDDAYEGRTYPTEFVMVRFAFHSRQPVGTKTTLHRLVYDKRKPRSRKAPAPTPESIFQ